MVIVFWWHCLKATEHQPMEMMPTANLMSQDAFKRAPVSSAHSINMLTPPQPPKVWCKVTSNYDDSQLDYQVLNKKRLHELVEEVDPTQLIDEDVEEVSSELWPYIIFT